MCNNNFFGNASNCWIIMLVLLLLLGCGGGCAGNNNDCRLRLWLSVKLKNQGADSFAGSRPSIFVTISDNLRKIY